MPLAVRFAAIGTSLKAIARSTVQWIRVADCYVGKEKGVLSRLSLVKGLGMNQLEEIDEYKRIIVDIDNKNIDKAVLFIHFLVQGVENDRI